MHSRKSRYQAPKPIEEEEVPWDTLPKIDSHSENKPLVETNSPSKSSQTVEEVKEVKEMNLSSGQLNEKIGKEYIYVVTSRKADNNETILHRHAKTRQDAALYMEKLALDELKKERGLSENDEILNPLNDTVGPENIIEGSTIRYRKDNYDIIDLIKIQRVDVGVLFSSKKRNQCIIKNFQITKVECV
jgi:hypothetical protein